MPKPSVAVLRNPAGPWTDTIIGGLAHYCTIVPIDRPARSADGATPSRSWGLVRDVQRVRRSLSQIKPDALLTLYGGSYAAVSWASRFRPSILYVVGSDILGLSRPKSILARLCLSSATAVIANGESLSKRATSLMSRGQATSIPHGIPLEKFPFRVAPAASIRVLVTRGSAPVYGQDLILRALATVRSARPIEVTFLGADASTRSLLAGWNRSSTAIRLLDRVGHDAVPRIMADHTHYLSMSKHDGTSSSLLEAMATGLYPIVSDIPANREWLSDDPNRGRLVPRTAESLARILDSLTLPPPRGLAENRSEVERKGNAAVNVKKIFDTITLIGRPSHADV